MDARRSEPGWHLEGEYPLWSLTSYLRKSASICGSSWFFLFIGVTSCPPVFVLPDSALGLMKSSSVNQQLGDFLRKRREKLKPKDVGLPSGNQRRTPGLRREEVAELAGISTDWYVRLEQGPDTLPSLGTVNALAKALALAPNERSHVHSLAAGQVNCEFGHERVPPFLAALVHDMPLPAHFRVGRLSWA